MMIPQQQQQQQLHSRAVQLNNHAVSLLQSGDFEQAETYFSAAFKSSKDALNQEHQRMAVGYVCPSLDDCLRFSRGRPLASSTSTSTSGDDDDKTSSSSSSSGMEDYIFSQSISIPLTLLYPSYKSKIFVTTIAVYNLALCLHLRARKQASQRVFHLEKAAQLYEQAYNLQYAHHNNNTNSIIATHNLFSMATLNNLGQIFRELQNHENARHCGAQLLSTLLYMVERNNNSDISLSMDCVRGFFQTTSKLIPSSRGDVMNKKTAAAA